MSLCINPDCKHSNSDEQVFCKKCGSEILLKGRYQVVRLLSEKGGFADTYEVTRHGVTQVLKVLKDTTPKAIELFKREFEVLNQSDHHGIPKAEEYFEFIPRNSSVTLQCLVMEKILGIDLDEYMKRLGNPIDERCATDWMGQIAQILQVIHERQLLHRDIKPSNIILKPDGQLTLIDFGAVGHVTNQASSSPSQTCIYTPGYAAPEQIFGKAVLESDFFSLGCTLVYLLTHREIDGMRDNNGDLNWEPYVTHLSPQLVEIINRMMSKQIDLRPHNAAEIIDWVAENQFKSYSSFHNKYVNSAVAEPTAPIVPNQSVKAVISPTLQLHSPQISTPESSNNQQTNSVNKSNQKRLAILSACVGISLFGACLYAIIRLLTPPTTNSTTPNPIANVSSRQCSTPDLVKKAGNLYGVIEIGSKGIKAEVIQELDTLNDAGFKYVARGDQDPIESRNVNATNPTAKDATVKAVTEVMKEIQTRFSIPCEQIVIYGSSGLAKKAPHKEELMKAIESASERKMEFISAADEAKYGFDGFVPDWRRSEVISIDIGSGNTKGAFLKDGKKEYETYEVLVGTGDFSKEIDKQRGDKSFVIAAAERKKTVVIPQIRNAIQLKPALLNSPRIYLTGGISWALATLTHPCDKDQTVMRKEERVSEFTRLRAEDINTFYNNVTRGRKTLFKPNLSACSPEQLVRAKKDINKIQKDVFSENELIAGAEILRAFSEESKFSGKDSIFFARYGIDALPIGYLIQRLEQRTN